MELKYHFVFGLAVRWLGSNRTFMELKSRLCLDTSLPAKAF